MFVEVQKATNSSLWLKDVVSLGDFSQRADFIFKIKLKKERECKDAINFFY